MKIGINVRNISNMKKSGVDIYVKQLALNIPKHDPQTTYFLFVDNDIKRADLRRVKRPNTRVIKIPTHKDKLYFFLLKFVANILRLDLFHFPVAIVPEGLYVPYVISVLDLTFEVYPEFYASDDLVKQKRTKNIAKESRGVLAISESTKQDLMKFYHINPNKIFVTHLALRESQNNGKYVISVKRRKPYILFVGNIQPRKNLINIVKALGLMDKFTRPNLQIIGSMQDRDEYERVNKLINDLDLLDEVKIYGYVNNKKLKKFFCGCSALIYPSLYEGFGYNILEAFKYRKPIITSSISSMPEIAGDAGIYVNPKSPRDIARGIKIALTGNADLKHKINLGSKRLKMFSEEAMAEATINAYRSIIEVSKR